MSEVSNGLKQSVLKTAAARENVVQEGRTPNSSLLPTWASDEHGIEAWEKEGSPTVISLPVLESQLSGSSSGAVKDLIKRLANWAAAQKYHLRIYVEEETHAVLMAFQAFWKDYDVTKAAGAAELKIVKIKIDPEQWRF